MVCKINFDYEIQLSDENDSISSSNLSSDDETYGKKFILGDNILNFNQVEVFSVRQLNDSQRSNSNESISDCQSYNEIGILKIPINNYLYYDESISDFEEESVTESESDFYLESTISEDKEFQSPILPLKYELPTVNRFQIVSHEVNKSFKNITEAGQYSINEKFRRLQAEITEKEMRNNQLNSDVKELNAGNHETLKTRMSGINEISENQMEENPISSEILSNLPIDLLTKFINGEKSLTDIVNQLNKITSKKRKKSKKHKRPKIEKKLDKYVKLIRSDDCPVPVTDKIDMEITDETIELEYIVNNISNTEFQSTDNILSDNFSLISEHDANDNQIQVINDCTVIAKSETLQHLSNTNKFKKKKRSKSSFKEKNNNQTPCQASIISKEPYQMYTDLDPICDSVKLIEYFVNDKTNVQTHLTSEENQTVHESNADLNSSSHQELPYANNDDILLCTNLKISSNSIQEIFETKHYENSKSVYPLTDDCKDNRTSSTDSGFHETDEIPLNEKNIEGIRDSTNDVNSLETQEFETIQTKLEILNDLNMVLPFNIDQNFQTKSVHDILDLSSFKFNFINESHLSSPSTNQIFFKENTSMYNSITSIAPVCSIETEKINTQKEEPPKSIASETVVNHHHQDLINTNEVHTTMYSTSNTNNKVFIRQKPDKAFYKTQNINTFQCEDMNRDKITCRKYDPFKINYHSPESAIDNKEEIALFLHYQWFKFCEKYTLYNHSMML